MAAFWGNSTKFSIPIEYLIVAGGGGGGGHYGGGGGAGGAISSSISLFPTGQTYSVVIGAGGAGGAGYSSTTGGGNGSNTTAFGLTATGGGGGGTRINLAGSAGKAGGSGGGGASEGSPITGGAGVAGQGNAGGTGYNNSGNSSGAGGGGSQSVGIAGALAKGGDGGSGIQFNILSNGQSAYFDGNGDYLTVPFSPQFVFNSNFTIEGWFYPQSLPTTDSQKYILASWNAGENLRSFFLILQDVSGVLKMNLGFSINGNSGTGNTFSVSLNTGSISINTWYHFAVVRSGTTVTMYLNGTSLGTGTMSETNFLTSSPISIGADVPGLTAAYYWNGYLSNIRIVNGTAIYTSNFTPSTSPLTAIENTSLLTCQTNNFIDTSVNAFTITASGNAAMKKVGPFTSNLSYSTAFNGTSDGLVINSNNIVNFGTGDFTVEAWIMLSTINTSIDIIITNYDSGGNGGFAFQVNRTTAGRLEVYSGNTFVLGSSRVIGRNTPHHVAVVRSSGTTTIYINGQANGSIADSNNYGQENASTGIGSGVNGLNNFPGVISNLRVVKGAAIYTSNFTPSASPLTAVSGTSLLTCQDTTFIDNSENNYPIQTINDPKFSIFNPFLYSDFYAAGGGGGCIGTAINGAGGMGMSSSGVSAGYAVSAIANTGNGGGGAAPNTGGVPGGAGGSGAFILKMPKNSVAIPVTGNPSITVSERYKIYKWTSSGSFTI